MTQILFNKSVFSKDDFNKVIDTRFKQLVGVQPSQDNMTLDDFFQMYEDLFFEIPKEGDIQSHRYILNRTADYLGVKISEENDIQALLDEITSLRGELLDANKTLLDLTKK
jgi:hypothetical protein